MFSRPLIRLRKTVAVRLTLWYSAIFIASALLLFSIAYLALSSSLALQDKDAMAARLDELASAFESSGPAGIRAEAGAVRKFEKTSPFFVRLAAPDGATLYLSMPSQWSEFDLLRMETKEAQSGNELSRVPDRAGRSFLEIASRGLPGGFVIQVGKSTEERDEILRHFRGIFTAVMVPLILVGFLGGVLLGYRALAPVRNLVATIRSIGAGRMEARVPVPQTGDELEELARLFNAMVEKIDLLVRAMRQSLDNVAHDLRTPMTRLRGMAEIALLPGQDSSRCRDVLSDCVEESERVLTILNTLLDISEAETGVIRLDLKEIRAADLVERIADLYSYAAEEKGVSLSWTCKGDPVIRADAARINTALANLVDNAVKYTPSGGKVEIIASEEEGKVLLSVTDNGCGIEESELPRIWERLYRGDKSRSEKGLGLGLSLVKAIVEAHKGTVKVDSVPNKGSRFTVVLDSAASSP